MEDVVAYTVRGTVPAVGLGFAAAILFRTDGIQAGVTADWAVGLIIAAAMITVGSYSWARLLKP